MITSKQIQELSGMLSEDHLISSLYLRLWPDFRIHRTTVKHLIQEKRERLDQESLPKEERQAVEEDFEKLRKCVDTFQRVPHRGLVIFSCCAQGIWEVFPLPQPVRDLLILDYSAYIRPLAVILDEYRRVCTLLVDRTKARIFEIFMAEIEEQSEIFTSVPSKVREAGWYGLREKRIERHIKHHLHAHLKKVADQTLIYFRTRGFDWLLLGGHPETQSEMVETLHSSLRQRLKRTFRIDVDSHPKDVLDRTLEIEREIKKQEDRNLVSRLANALKPGGLGVSGIHQTLSSLYERNVHTFLVEEEFSQEGAYCFKCGFMGLRAASCPICREDMTPVPDIVDEAVATAIDQNCEVVHVSPDSGLKELGSIGALLRYKPGVPKYEEEPR